MARVSISEAARLVKVSRPTIYKMINSGKLSYTSVVKHGKGIKVIDTSELIRVFGSLDGEGRSLWKNGRHAAFPFYITRPFGFLELYTHAPAARRSRTAGA
jgi:excisionase family DNA binding protein